MFRVFRIVVLLIVLAGVAGSAWLTQMRTTSWQRPLRVVMFPINADGSGATASFVAALGREAFQPIDDFMRDEAQRYALAQRDPVDVDVAPRVDSLPPAAPYGGNPVQIALWSLRLRFWAWRNADYPGPRPDVRMFLLYHDPARVTRVAHSLGLQKGLIGVVHVFASEEQAGSNNVVIAHELLHTVGASDKYDAETNQPRHPEGYAEPEREPLLPQTFGEIMGGRIPVSADDAHMPQGLQDVLIGTATAREINWLRN
jgi:hypothetical protein